MLTSSKHGITRGPGTAARSEEARQKELQQITAYKDLMDLVNTKVCKGSLLLLMVAADCRHHSLPRDSTRSKSSASQPSS